MVAALFVVITVRTAPAQAQAQQWTCGSEQSFFNAIYAPGWDYISGYTDARQCDRACQGLRNCSAFYCVSIGYCMALHAPGSSGSGSGGGGGGGTLRNLPTGSACSQNQQCASGQCMLSFCQ